MKGVAYPLTLTYYWSCFPEHSSLKGFTSLRLSLQRVMFLSVALAGMLMFLFCFFVSLPEGFLTVCDTFRHAILLDFYNLNVYLHTRIFSRRQSFHTLIGIYCISELIRTSCFYIWIGNKHLGQAVTKCTVIALWLAFHPIKTITMPC